MKASLNSPSTSRLGPMSTEFHPKVYGDGKFVNPSWCFEVKTKYLKSEKYSNEMNFYQFLYEGMPYFAPDAFTSSANWLALKNSIFNCAPKS